jgi:aminoglycoside phosphotransferase (APT) family kinase protein
MKLCKNSIQAYLHQLAGNNVDLLELKPLGDSEAATAVAANGSAPQRHPAETALKTFGYGKPVLVRYRVNDVEKRAVLHTAASNHFGHEYRADRAAEMLLAYDTFNQLPNHARALDVGVFTQQQALISLADATEFFLLTQYVEGEPYARDLQRMRDTGQTTGQDVPRTRALARYLVDLHAEKCADPALYYRHLRETIGNGEGIMGLADNYPTDFEPANPDWLETVEKECIRWRWKLKPRHQRLAHLHGDFHPFNILFAEGTKFHVLDRSRSVWGEPADDVTCLAINYLFFSLQRTGTLAPPFTRLWDTFWETYLDASGDGELLAVVAPFFVWRALVLASPVWYNIPAGVRETLFHFIDNVLHAERFEPDQIDRYLTPVRR